MDADPWGPLGLALLDYFQGDRTVRVTVHTEGRDPEDLPARHFFREPDDFPSAEVQALTLCRGRVLDVGAGAGDHALVLQRRGLAVTALDISPLAVEVMRRRGVRDARLGDLFRMQDERYDTLLMMMNGIGVVGTLEGLDRFLDRAHALLEPRGAILLDSTDLRRSLDVSEHRAMEARRGEGRYEGEVRFRMEYRGRKGGEFTWLFVDPGTLAAHAEPRGWTSQVVFEEEGGEYLARLRAAE
jgi:SAM-dependent methyltransferase